MAKHVHEVRDPIHVFMRVDSDERKVLDSRPFQRLRHIHQLALTYLVYPGATHRRFEHSLGVLELAGRVFDVVTNPDHIQHDSVRDVLPPPSKMAYWRQTLRMAALCHDIGHLPFLEMTDNEVTAAMLRAARDPIQSGHEPARRIVRREHYRLLYQRNPDDVAINPDAANAIAEAARGRFGADSVQYDTYRERNRGLDFPVLTHDGRVVSCIALSETLKKAPVAAVDYVYIAPHRRTDAEKWLQSNRAAIIAPRGEDQT
jgi:HD superfamily phosphohydrolase